MTVRHVYYLLNAFVLFFAATAQAEDNCGTMHVTAVRFAAQVDSMAPLPGWSGTLIDVDEIDPRYVVAITIRALDADDRFRDASVGMGARMNLAIHSPDRLIGTTAAPGRQLGLQLLAMHCDGIFRRYIDIAATQTLMPQPFRGDLEVGRTYRASVRRDRRGDLELTQSLRLPMHQAGGIDWLNPQDLPTPGEHDHTRSVEFDVLSRTTQQIGEREWATNYACAVRRAKSKP